jgi:hypothetical protein
MNVTQKKQEANKARDRLCDLLEQINENDDIKSFRKNTHSNVICVIYENIEINIAIESGLLSFYSSFVIEHKITGSFSELLLGTCDITEHPSIQASNTDQNEVSIWSREWMDKIDDDDFYTWLERFCEVASDWQLILSEYKRKI